MPEDVRAALFTDAARSTKPGGTGLGTRIVGRIVEQHGGTASVQSAPGRGTTITLRLPKQPPTAADDLRLTCRLRFCDNGARSSLSPCDHSLESEARREPRQHPP